MQVAVLLLALLAAAEAGLLRVPKIYNTVITSDANLEPSRAYPIVQPVLSVGVQPVIAAAPFSYDQRGPAPYYPVPVGGLYPFLASTNALYPTALLYPPAGHGAHATAAAAPNPAPQPAAQPAAQPAPQAQPAQSVASAPANAQHHQHVHGDVLNNSYRLQNADIPDVPPPPLPVRASKTT